MSELPRWDALAALAQECAVRFDRDLKPDMSERARALRSNFIWAASDAHAKSETVWVQELQELMSECGLSPKPPIADDPDPTPRQSGTLQRSPIWAAICRQLAVDLHSLIGRTLLARDNAASVDQSIELSARLLEAGELIHELGECARVFDAWQTRDPGADARNRHIIRFQGSEGRANRLIKANASVAPPAIEVVQAKKSKWP